MPVFHDNNESYDTTDDDVTDDANDRKGIKMGTTISFIVDLSYATNKYRKSKNAPCQPFIISTVLKNERIIVFVQVNLNFSLISYQCLICRIRATMKRVGESFKF